MSLFPHLIVNPRDDCLCALWRRTEVQQMRALQSGAGRRIHNTLSYCLRTRVYPFGCRFRVLCAWPWVSHIACSVFCVLCCVLCLFYFMRLFLISCVVRCVLRLMLCCVMRAQNCVCLQFRVVYSLLIADRCGMLFLAVRVRCAACAVDHCVNFVMLAALVDRTF